MNSSSQQPAPVSYNMKVYEPGVRIDGTTQLRLDKMSTQSKQLYLVFEAVRVVCPGLGSDEDEVKMVTKIMNIADPLVQADPDFATACLVFRFNDPSTYGMWANIDPRMRDDMYVVEHLVRSLGQYRGTAYAAAVLACVSPSVLKTTSFFQKLIDNGVYEAMQYAPDVLRFDKKWVLGIVQKASPKYWRDYDAGRGDGRRMFTFDVTSRVLPYVEPTLLLDSKFVAKIAPLSLRAVFDFVDPAVWAKPMILQEIVNLIDSRDEFRGMWIPEAVAGLRDVAIAFAKKGGRMWTRYTEYAPEKVWHDKAFMMDIMQPSEGRSVLKAPDSMIRDPEIFAEALRCIKDYMVMRTLVKKHKDAVFSHLSDVSAVEKAIVPSRGVVLFACPEWVFNDAILCGRIIQAMKFNDEYPSMYSAKMLYTGLGDLADSKPSFKALFSNKDFVLSCVNESIANYIVRLTHPDLFLDAGFTLKLQTKAVFDVVEQIHDVVHDRFDARISEMSKDVRLAAIDCVSTCGGFPRYALKDMEGEEPHLPEEFRRPECDVIDYPFYSEPLIKFAGRLSSCYSHATGGVHRSEEEGKLLHIKFMEELDEAVAFLMSNVERLVLDDIWSNACFDANVPFSSKDPAVRKKVKDTVDHIYADCLQRAIEEIDGGKLQAIHVEEGVPKRMRLE